MTKYATMNPLGSTSPYDLFDNAQNFDIAFNSITAAMWLDRFGKPRHTWYGLEAMAKAAIAAFGYITMDSFQAGSTLTLPNQVLRDTSTGEYYRWDGTFPKVVPAGSTPAASGGISIGAWLSVGDAVLRGQISDPDGAEKYPELQMARWRDQGDIRGWGAKSGGVIDSAAEIAAAISWAVSTGNDLTASGVFRCSSGITLPTGRYSLNFTGAKIIFDAGVSVAVTVGTAGSDPYRGTIRGLHIEKNDYEGSDIGVLLLNCVEAGIENPVVTNFSKAIACIPGASSRVAYSTILNPALTNHEYGFYVKPPASSYVNENTIIGGRFASNVNGRLVDQIYLDNATGQGVQHNRFIGVSIEGYNGSGACGRTAINVVNDANQNIFSFCRTEKYGTGWSSGYSVTFGSNTSGNLIEDPRIDVTISDVSGLNQWDTRLGGIKRVGHSTAVSANPMIQLIRSQPLNNAATKFAIDIQDTYAASGDAGLLRYQSKRGSGNVIEITTFYGDVLKVTGEGEFLTAIKTPYVETTSDTEPNYFNSRIGTVGTKTLTPKTAATGLLVFSNTSSNTGGVGAEFITNNVAGRQHISFSNPNGVVGSISTSANATSFNTSSDESLKFGVEDADPSGDIIDAIQVRQFNWKADGSHQDYGFIAQELHKVFPYAVTDGGDDEEAMWSVDYSKLVPIVIKEAQQLRHRINFVEDTCTLITGNFDAQYKLFTEQNEKITKLEERLVELQNKFLML